MNKRRALAVIAFFIIPAIFLSAFLYSLNPLYEHNLHLVKRGSIGSHPLNPPTGVADIKLNFTKEDVKDSQFTLHIDSTVSCNQTPCMTFAFYRPDFNKYSVCSLNMQLKDSTPLYGFNTERFKASYFGWNGAMAMSTDLDKYYPYGFPFDEYGTTRFVIAFTSQEVSTFAKLYIESWELNSQVPAGFSVSMVDIKELSKTELEATLGSSAGLQDTIGFSFKITMLRDNESLLLLSIYSFVPLLGIWSMFVITEFLISKPRDRISVFAGAVLAAFAYLFTMRNFMPPTLTIIEISIIVILGAWALTELWKAYKYVVRTSHLNQIV